MSLASLPEAEKRIEQTDNKSASVKNYDEDNLYPQNMDDISNASGTASACIKLYAKHVTGKGFKDEIFYTSKINSKGLTPDKLLRKVSKKIAKGRGYAIHVNYNSLLKIVDAKHVPFEYCRLGIAEKAGMIAVYDNWDGAKGKFDKDKIEYIHQFNLSQEVLLQQINGDITTYKGQILWRSLDGEDYPLAPFDAVVEDVITDAEIKKFRLRNTRKGFGPSTIVEYGYKFENDEIRKEVVKGWGKFVGPDSPDVLVLENENGNGDEKTVQITKLDSQNNDKMYEVTNKTVKDSIIQSFNQPPILLGVSSTGVFKSDEIQDAYKFYNSITSDERLIIEEDFKMIFSNFYIDINPTKDYSIVPLEFNVVSTEKPALINTIGIGGAQTLVAIVSNKDLSEQQKVNMVKSVFGISTEEAQGMVLGTPLAT